MATGDSRLPRISVVVPSYNQGHFLAETLESLVRQNYPYLEIVVMDGGSTDQSVEIIRRYEQHLAYWQSQPDGGQSAAINAGMARCQGDLVAWLNSDDYYWCDSLWTVGRAYAELPGRGLYIGNGLRYNQAADRYSPFCRYHVALNREALTFGLDYILQPATFFARSAWQEVGGLNPDLRFCMDWDIILRIAQRYPAVLINDFLAVSREYEETKTSSGKLGRAIEIARLVQHFARQEVTPGSLFYLFETLLDVTAGQSLEPVRQHIYDAMNAVRCELAQRYGNGDGFPEQSDPQDSVYLPFATATVPQRPFEMPPEQLPKISVITPSFNQAAYLGKTLESLFSQGYPKLETLVFDGGSSDNSIEVLVQYDSQLTAWVSERDRGPAHAINKGFAAATGEIVAWLNSDDVLAADALWTVARAFAEDPELDMVYANALYIDEHDQLYIADHGTHRTGLYYGQMQQLERVPAYWSYVHAIPQPTVFFRRRLLEQCGILNESYHFIFDFELFWRFAWKAKIKKLEQTLAFYRIHAASKTSDWNRFLVELYTFSRPWWPKLRSPEFRYTLRDFVASYMRSRFGGRQRDLWFWGAAGLVAAQAALRVGNPEALRLRLPSVLKGRAAVGAATNGTLPPSATSVISQVAEHLTEHVPCVGERRTQRYRSAFCSLIWPLHPGHSGGEIRDFHLLRRLLAVSEVEFFAAFTNPAEGRSDLLAPLMAEVHKPETMNGAGPEQFHPWELQRPLKNRVVDRVRRAGLPVLGPRFPLDVASRFPHIQAYCRPGIERRLAQDELDFLFVSPQTNPLALSLRSQSSRARLIMASYDVEIVRMHRLAASQHGLTQAALQIEARRAAAFERDNLALYDGVIAVSEIDRQIFIRDLGVPAERVLTIENGVDPDYFAFQERPADPQPRVVFVGSLTYLPNRQAAWRLLHQIMPLVWAEQPQASVWIVGQSPDEELCAQHDGQRIIVTGRVDDVRPYLAAATVACVPLVSGSGTKYKVLEALSAGVPLVCTPLAAEGLNLAHDTQVLLGQSDQELAAAILRLIADPCRAVELARCGRECIEQQYAWDANLARLDGWLDQLHQLPRRVDEAVTIRTLE